MYGTKMHTIVEPKTTFKTFFHLKPLLFSPLALVTIELAIENRRLSFISSEFWVETDRPLIIV